MRQRQHAGYMAIGTLGCFAIDVEDLEFGVSFWLRCAEVERIGGRLKYPPSLFPVPHAREGARPLIDWAVVQDPFRNEFCPGR